MYIPKHFAAPDTQKLQQYIRDYSFGLLIVADKDGIEANHLPFYLKTPACNPLGVLQCHVARGNPVWQRIEQNTARVLAVFQGPEAYISPSWYPSKAETGRVVPTWNYLAIHAQGTARVVQDADWLKQHLHSLTDQHESGREQPWSVDDAPSDYTERLMRGIVGIDISIETLTGKLKASQNQSAENTAGVKDGLKQRGGLGDSAMAELIR